MSKEVVAEVIALIELGMIAPEDIVKCLRKANAEPEKALAEQPAQQALDKMAENARELGLDYEPAQPEPVALKWQQAPVKTQWGDEMVVASVAIDKDHTVCLYCERDQTPKVDAMFAQRTWVGLTDEEIMECLDQGYGINMRLDGFAKIIEAKLKEKNSA